MFAKTRVGAWSVDPEQYRQQKDRKHWAYYTCGQAPLANSGRGAISRVTGRSKNLESIVVVAKVVMSSGSATMWAFKAMGG
ncbi:hypothetical protein NDU88_011428 [Pleurodeles waltl]|uniref:Uncharacterized protein n=1 Tax=Pleurodeles waltl TaxID=8319 RepID=A0AAV7R1C5_PLEWA|nr:hypothetical protein NDU88_011428 [Pleurodeles waltl]